MAYNSEGNIWYNLEIYGTRYSDRNTIKNKYFISIVKSINQILYHINTKIVSHNQLLLERFVFTKFVCTYIINNIMQYVIKFTISTWHL